MPADAREQMIQAAAVLLAKSGPQAMSFSRVLDESGAPRGSLYHHFPGGKDELIRAASQATHQRAMAHLSSLEGQPADDVAAAFVEMWRTVLVRSKFSAGCSVVALTVSDTDAEYRELANTVFRDWTTQLTKLISRGGVERGLAKLLATNLVAACEGAVVLARASGTLTPFNRVAEVQLALVRSSMK